MLSLLGPRPKRSKRALKGIPAPRSEELSYLRSILAITRQAEALVRALVLPALPGLLNASLAPRADDLGDDIGRLFGRLKSALAGVDESARAAAVTMLERVQRKHATSFQAAYEGAVPAISPMLGGEPWLREQMRMAVAENARLITSIPSTMLGDVEGMVTRGVLEGVRVEALARQIVERFAVSEARAANIATTSVLQWHGQVSRLRMLDAGVTRYRWSTSQDEKVRPGHRALNGTEQKWSTPPIDDPRTGARHHPGMAPRCRCVATPVLDGDT